MFVCFATKATPITETIVVNVVATYAMVWIVTRGRGER